MRSQLWPAFHSNIWPVSRAGCARFGPLKRFDLIFNVMDARVHAMNADFLLHASSRIHLQKPGNCLLFQTVANVYRYESTCIFYETVSV